MHPSRSHLAGAAAAAACLVVGLAYAGTAADAAPSATLVVSEVYGGGGNSGATYTNDFIELYNAGANDADLGGHSVQYHSSSATGGWQATTLTGTIPAGGHYLVQEAQGSGGTEHLPTPDATGTIAMSGAHGTVALVHSTDELSCAADTCGSDSSIADLVGWGGAKINESSPAPATTNETSVSRDADGTDTDDNSADFSAGDPTPMNSGTGSGGTPPGQAGPLAIHDIQGASFVSPHNKDTVTNVPGIVTALRTSGSSKGYWIQDPNPDNDPATSEGVLVYTGSTPTVHVGDSVLVSGTVSDYYTLSSGETLSSTSNLSVTEITDSTAQVLSSGNDLPAPVVITPKTIPDTYAPDLGGGNIEDTPITPDRSALDYYESIEGMRVEVDKARVVGPSNSYGEQYVTTKPKQDRTYRGGTELKAPNATPSGRLEVATLDGSELHLNVNDVLKGATIGPIDYSSFGGYTLEASTLGTVKHHKLKPVVADSGHKRKLSIATYNVENLAASDPESKFTALAKGIVTNLASPDIVGLEEVQDNDGATDDGVVSPSQTLGKLTRAIIAAGGPHYDYRQVDPVNDQDGGEPGGNIRNVFLYNPSRVTFNDIGSPSVDRSTAAAQVEKKRHEPTLSLSPGRIDPANPVWQDSRKPIVGQFTFRGKHVFVITNHFDSKFGDQNADGRFQYPQQSSRVQRSGQAQVVHDFVNKILGIDRKAQVVVIGDLNDYQFSSPLNSLRTGTADGSGKSILTDLITTLRPNRRYTYVYDGISQVLDHILVTKRVRGVSYQVVHINSEYSNQASDHDPQVVEIRP